MVLLHVLCLSLVIIAGFVVHAENNGDIREYCKLSKFSPSCIQGEVVVMTHAVYGMIKVGKCLHEVFGFLLGCVSEELQHFDRRCSGKQSCEIPSGDEEVLNTKLTCLQSGSYPYLEASYTCLKVYSDLRECTSPKKLEATTKTQQLSSKISMDTSCGQQNTPYILEAKTGQTIDISLTDFSWKNNSEICVTYGYILDTQSDDVINICGHGIREKLLYTSSGNTVQIMLENNALQDNQFLIEFKATGCPDLDAPQHGWVKKDANLNTATVGCYATDDTWQLRCVDNVWLGHSGTCGPEFETKSAVPYSPSTTVVTQRADSEEINPVGITRNHVLIVTMGCMTLILCSFVIIVGIYCIKRYQRKSLRECGMSHQPDDYSYRGNQETLMMLPTYNMSLNGTPTLNQTPLTNSQNGAVIFS